MAFRYVAALLALAFALLSGPALAAPQDAVFNKEGVWGIDVDGGACAASMTLPDGAIFLLRAANGEMNVALFARAKLKKGKVGRIETDAGGFDFRPGWSEGDVYTEDTIGAPAVATLRAARQVRIVIDGRPVMDVSVAGTGFADAVDGVIACSQGQNGWWGKGVHVADAEPGEPQEGLDAAGFWRIERHAASCMAAMHVEGDLEFMLLAEDGGLGFGVGTPKPMMHGTKGVLHTEAYVFEFEPRYGRDDDVVYRTGPLDQRALGALRLARKIGVSVDGKMIMAVTVEGTGFDHILDDVAACSKGESGWWGKGAAKAP
jgi:hypothetical protein